MTKMTFLLPLVKRTNYEVTTADKFEVLMTADKFQVFTIADNFFTLMLNIYKQSQEINFSIFEIGRFVV
jgi:hypothetical protein